MNLFELVQLCMNSRTPEGKIDGLITVIQIIRGGTVIYHGTIEVLMQNAIMMSYCGSKIISWYIPNTDDDTNYNIKVHKGMIGDWTPLPCRLVVTVGDPSDDINPLNKVNLSRWSTLIYEPMPHIQIGTMLNLIDKDHLDTVVNIVSQDFIMLNMRSSVEDFKKRLSSGNISKFSETDEIHSMYVLQLYRKTGDTSRKGFYPSLTIVLNKK